MAGTSKAKGQKDKLTVKQRLFCQHYAMSDRAGWSARQAGFGDAGADIRAQELLRQQKITDEIDRLRKQRMKSLDVTLDRVMLELAHVAFADVGEICKWNQSGFVEFKPSEEMPRSVRCAVQSVELTKDGMRVKMHPKMPALEKLMDYLVTKGVDDADGETVYVFRVGKREAPPANADEVTDAPSDENEGVE
jgi:phage terminase small subunit